MTRDQLEHVIRAATTIADEDVLIVVGSQAILGQFPNAPDSLRQSLEADVYPEASPEKAELIDGSIGEGSPFHETFGYYAHGVGPETATLPKGWRPRAVEVCGPGTRGATGVCPEIHDLLVSKLAAGRPKDIDFVAAAIAAGLALSATVAERIEGVDSHEEERRRLRERLQRATRLGSGPA